MAGVGPIAFLVFGPAWLEQRILNILELLFHLHHSIWWEGRGYKGRDIRFTLPP